MSTCLMKLCFLLKLLSLVLLIHLIPYQYLFLLPFRFLHLLHPKVLLLPSRFLLLLMGSQLHPWLLLCKFFLLHLWLHLHLVTPWEPSPKIPFTSLNLSLLIFLPNHPPKPLFPLLGPLRLNPHALHSLPKPTMEGGNECWIHWLNACTWSLVSHKPNMNFVGCKRVFQIKRKPNGSIERYKACLVAKGFHPQKWCVLWWHFQSCHKAHYY